MGFSVKLENISKRYTIYHQNKERYKTLRDTISASVKNIFSKEKTISKKEDFWALKDINFEIKEGDKVGIIGRNGAGKSTLLKVLSRITEPTTGKFTIKGRVSSLLEVGTGFHPELTGRENIYLNGSILGMKKTEIKKKFDEIVAFSEVEKFLDTPVKRYSSGMYVRLAFSVAAHLEPEILIVDEVLAVGDASFQKKCLGKMGEIGESGRTVLFVSHNMGAIKQLCTSAVYLKEGQVFYNGLVDDAIKYYMETTNSSSMINMKIFSGTLSNKICFNELLINGKKEKISINPSQEIVFRISGNSYLDIPNFRITLSIYCGEIRLFTIHDTELPVLLPKGVFQSFFRIPPFFLRPGDYSIALGGYREGATEWMYGTDLQTFNIVEEWSKNNDFANVGIINIPCETERICSK